jgi:hypothetical protein
VQELARAAPPFPLIGLVICWGVNAKNFAESRRISSMNNYRSGVVDVRDLPDDRHNLSAPIVGEAFFAPYGNARRGNQRANLLDCHFF